MTDPADLARQHGASWAKQLNEDELMKMEQHDYSTRTWAHPPRKPNGPNALIVVIVAAACLTLLPGIAALVAWGML